MGSRRTCDTRANRDVPMVSGQSLPRCETRRYWQPTCRIWRGTGRAGCWTRFRWQCGRSGQRANKSTARLWVALPDCFSDLWPRLSCGESDWDGRPTLTNKHPVISPGVLAAVCDPLLHCDGFGDGVVRDADVCRVLCEVLEGRRRV